MTAPRDAVELLARTAAPIAAALAGGEFEMSPAEIGKRAVEIADAVLDAAAGSVADRLTARAIP